MSTDDLDRRLVEASRAVTEWVRKDGTPEYDRRAHQHAVEHERALRDELDAKTAVDQG